MKYKTLKSTQTLTVPCLRDVDDYHEIEDLAIDLKKAFGKGVRVEEIGFANGMYWALVWHFGEKPNQDQVREMLSEVGVAYDKML